jgi:hypothetical protein
MADDITYTFHRELRLARQRMETSTDFPVARHEPHDVQHYRASPAVIPVRPAIPAGYTGYSAPREEVTGTLIDVYY